ncbi:MAG: alpha/beta fold hydrolase [Wenzhouxiangellaceae bacterium]|nr:alpha/beta fold hydrolase [Wenzhouxiangellaceae bacterium]
MSRIVTLHGWAMHSGLFEDLERAAPDHEWIGLDLPGHGRRREAAWPDDPVADVAARAADALGDGGLLLGWSLGGLLALQAVLRGAVAPRGLVLVAATPCFLRRPHWPDGVEPALLKAMSLDLVSNPEAVFQRFLALEIQGAADARAELRRLRALATRHGLPDPAALVAGLNHLSDSDVSGSLNEVCCPVLLIGGRRDRLVPWAALERTAEALPDARLARIPGAAHAPFLTRPGLVADEIDRFLDEMTPRR